MIEVYFDGLCEPKNPGGIATYGYAVSRDGKKVHEGRGLACTPFAPEATNNLGEYMGAIKALEYLAEEGLTSDSVIIRGDSKLVVEQSSGRWKVKSPAIAPLNARIRELALKFADLKFEWVPREQNRDADALTNLALAEYKASQEKK